MPTYKNLSQDIITNLMDINGNYPILHPYKEIQSYKYYSMDILQKTSDEPYYNPLIQSDIPTLSDSSDEEIILINSSTKTLQISNLSSNLVYLFFQSTSNTPSTIIFPNSNRDFIIQHKNYTQIILKTNSSITANQLFIQQFII